MHEHIRNFSAHLIFFNTPSNFQISNRPEESSKHRNYCYAANFTLLEKTTTKQSVTKLKSIEECCGDAWVSSAAKPGSNKADPLASTLGCSRIFLSKRKEFLDSSKFRSQGNQARKLGMAKHEGFRKSLYAQIVPLVTLEALGGTQNQNMTDGPVRFPRCYKVSWCSPLPKGNGYNLSTKIGAQRKVAQSQRAVPLQGHISLTTGQAPNRSDLLTNSLCFLIPISFLQDLAPKTRLPLTPNIVSGFL
ncbi:hypothetical protein RRG08_029872 [Elysia crispata]|uniref:Uncharacterized protein n=1 Tax=Elysia crispata TaxID=231223 RepID=A0AAE1D0F0_9GAST|nr:hypothetical protein RRG08_029872 [Elysia crispata]